MKELISHIEYLLLENDCVILPNFGGFITHYAPALWVEDENTFLPPYRTVGFNAQLKINDGLLVQSYMQTHDATYPEAARLVEDAVELFAETLYKEGFIEMYGIGTLRRTIRGEYQFEPMENGVITPELYGFGALPITPLSALTQKTQEPIRITVPVGTPELTTISEKEESKEKFEPNIFEEDIYETTTPALVADTTEDKAWTIRIKHQWLANIISVAAAVLLFFALSIPVDNTYIEEENFASLGSLDLLKQLSERSMVTTLLPESKVQPQENVIELTKTENPATTHTTEQPVATTEIVQSETLAASSSATTEVKKEVPETPVAIQPEIKKETVKNTEIAVPEKSVAKTTKTKYYHVIVASVTTQEDADRTISNYVSQGYEQAMCISGSGRFRISIAAFDTELKAYQKINELKEQGRFKDAWVLTRRQ